VQPRVERCDDGWQVFSPNCSRNVDPTGGEIPIAWLAPAFDGTWCLHAHGHADGTWRLRSEGLTLAQALHELCVDALHIYWP
jgi:hypothetical protein